MPVVLSPIAMGDLARRADANPNPNFNPGAGASSPRSFNNQVFLGVFATIAALMTLATLWFFFMARNGGFVWKENDWEDYKSTVLRRKGPDGKTLSNATKSTKLGGNSEAPTFSDNGGRYQDTVITESDYDPKDTRQFEEQQTHVPGSYSKSNRHRDPELKAYKYEKAAKVGGLNTAPAGSHYDYTNTERSEASAPQTSKLTKEQKKIAKEREREEKQRLKDAAKAEKKARKDAKKTAPSKSQPSYSKVPEMQQNSSPPQANRRSAPSAAYSFTVGDDTETVYTGTDAFSSYTSMTAPTAAARHAYAKAHPLDHYTDSVSSAAAQNPPAAAPSSEGSQQSYYYNAYRPNAELRTISEVSSALTSPSAAHAAPGRASQDRASPRQHRNSPDSRRSRQDGSPRKHRSAHREANSDTGTKAYPCHIPGISDREIGVNDSVSQVGARRERGGGGYRRRRDEEMEGEE